MVFVEKFRLEIIVFVVGAAVMILELTGSRVLAPYLGTSIFVWTSLIGVILASLSLGYFLGGRLADRQASYENFSKIIFLAAVSTGAIAFLKSHVLLLVQVGISDIRIGSIVATIILFSPATIFLGMVSPYAVKLKIKSIKKTGATVGSLYAVSTVGSILGTFLAGFLLISYLGHTRILLFVSLCLILTSALAFFKNLEKVKLTFFLVVLISIYGSYLVDTENREQGFIDVDTKYNRVLIFDSVDPKSNRPIKAMIFDPKATQSAMFLDSDELVFEYSKFYRLAEHFKENIGRSLVIGGAAYSYPKEYLKKYPAAYIDVVEIDPALTDLARKYFRLRDNPKLNIYHEDGRVFIDTTKNRYDAIFMDAFNSSFYVPYQLTTREAVNGVHRLLADDGIVIVNLISAVEGEKGKFLRAEYLTYKEVFGNVYLFPVEDSGDGNKVQNIILIASKSTDAPFFESNEPEISRYLKHLWTGEVAKDVPALTDDYAPVDQYLKELI